jgi:hypothetical protein
MLRGPILLVLLPIYAMAQPNNTFWFKKGAKLSQVIAFEKRAFSGSNIYFFPHKFKADSRFYPLYKEYKIDSTQPLIVERKQNGHIPLSVEYYYTKDSVVRMVCYQYQMWYEEDSVLEKQICEREYKCHVADYRQLFTSLLHKIDKVICDRYCASDDDCNCGLRNIELSDTKVFKDIWGQNWQTCDMDVLLQLKFNPKHQSIRIRIHWDRNCITQKELEERIARRRAIKGKRLR